LVTATEYGVSTTSGSDIVGVELDVYKIVPYEPTPEHPYAYEVEYAVKRMPFANGDEADEYCLKHGWLKEYQSELVTNEVK
jgi:hypothetical protein